MLTSSTIPGEAFTRGAIGMRPGDLALVFGGTGSLGVELVARMLARGMNVVVFSRDEAKQWAMRNDNITTATEGRLRFVVGDVRDARAVADVVRTTKPRYIVVAAALKQVDTCERQPREALATNVLGVQNIVDAVATTNIACDVCFVSTDKACSPVNVYGMCKAAAERIVVASAASMVNPSARFFVVRYGNVLNSRGSIVPLFQRQAQSVAPVFTVTHPSMTRFLMTLDESVDLIVDATLGAHNGETWIPVLPAMRVMDLAELFAAKYSGRVEVVGVRPGEKLHEALVNDVESMRCVRAVGASSMERYVLRSVHEPLAMGAEQHWYTSSDPECLLSREELSVYLAEKGILT